MKTLVNLSVDVEQMKFIKREHLSPTKIFRDIVSQIMDKSLKINKKWMIGVKNNGKKINHE